MSYEAIIFDLDNTLLNFELCERQAILGALEACRMTPKAYRWIGEMEEIAETFQDLGLTERIFYGAADVYRFVKDTSLGKETPEECNRDRPLRDIITNLSDKAASSVLDKNG